MQGINCKHEANTIVHVIILLKKHQLGT